MSGVKFSVWQFSYAIRPTVDVETVRIDTVDVQRIPQTAVRTGRRTAVHAIDLRIQTRLRLTWIRRIGLPIVEVAHLHALSARKLGGGIRDWCGAPDR